MIRLVITNGRKKIINMDFIKVQSLKWLMSNFLFLTERNRSTTSSSDILSIRPGDEYTNAKLVSVQSPLYNGAEERRLNLSLF